MKWLNDYRMRLVLVGFVAAIVLGGGRAKADFTFGEPVNLKSVIPVIDPMYESMNCLSGDGLEMFIGSGRPGGQGEFDLWVLRRTSVNGDWGPPENLGPVVNSPSADAMPSVSSDGLTLCFNSNRIGGHGSYDLYIITRASKIEPWGSPINLGPQVNSSFTDGDPWISADGLELYFDSKRLGGFGAHDIWVTKRATQNDPWSNPENLGSVVNSSYYDMSSCLSPDGLLLLFSGVYGHPGRPGGFGGSDIWMTRRTTTSDSWKEPINLGPKVNSATHEAIPRISPDGSMLYFSTIAGGIWDNWNVPIVPIVDFNGDRIVDAADMCIMVDYWGTDESLCDIGPMPWGDGIVDVEDLIVLSEHLFEEVNDPTLIAHWALDETEGMFAVDSAGDNNGYALGDPIWMPTDGIVDGALQLDGVDDYVLTGFVPDPEEGPFSVFTWIKGGAPGQVVLSQMGGANWLSADPSEGKLMTNLSCPPGRTPPPPLISEFVITDGEWHRIGLIWDGSNRTLCVDGVVVAEDTQDSLESSSNGLYIGTGKAMEPGTYFSGLIDDIRIYNRVVSP